jgi:hypothetical protein
MNLSQRSEDKELLSVANAKDNTMNLSERSEYKELFSETFVKENIIFYFTMRTIQMQSNQMVQL